VLLSHDGSPNSARLTFHLDPSRRPSRDLGGADVRRAIRVARSAYGREAGALSLSAGASLPPSPLFSRRRCHKVTRSLGSAGFTRAGVRTFDRSVGRHRPGNTLPIDDRAIAPRTINTRTHGARTRSSHVSGFSFGTRYRSLNESREPPWSLRQSMPRRDPAARTAPGKTARRRTGKSGSAARVWLARSVATAPRLTRARTVATGLSAVVQSAVCRTYWLCFLLRRAAESRVTTLARLFLDRIFLRPPSLVARFQPHSSPFLLSLSLSLSRSFCSHADRFNVPNVQRSSDADSHDDGFPSQKTSTTARALLRGGRWRRQSILPGFSRGSSPSLPFVARARARFYVLSSQWSFSLFLSPRGHDAFPVSLHLSAPSPSPLSRRRTARCPGRSEQLSPAFPPSHGACASRGCPPRSPRVLSFCLPDHPADTLSVSLRSTPSSFVPILLSSCRSANARLLSRLLPAFLLFPSFLLNSRCFYRPSSSSRPCYLAGPYTLFVEDALPEGTKIFDRADRIWTRARYESGSRFRLKEKKMQWSRLKTSFSSAICSFPYRNGENKTTVQNKNNKKKSLQFVLKLHFKFNFHFFSTRINSPRNKFICLSREMRAE